MNSNTPLPSSGEPMQIVERLALLWAWFIDTFASVLLPLFVYLLVYASLGLSLRELITLPEWMFSAIILYGDTLRRLILFSRSSKGFELKLQRDLAAGIAGITISAVLLCATIISTKREGFQLANSFYLIQMAVFIFALINAAYTRVWLAIMQGEAPLLSRFIPESQNQHEPKR